MKKIIKNWTIHSGIIQKYNLTRTNKNKTFFCHAPFQNIYFNIQGDAAPCWQSFINPDNYPAKSIKEIWGGVSFNEIREGISSLNLSPKCEGCRQNLIKGNYLSVLARAYDNGYALTEYPSMMELELGNVCNLECIMCNGHLSSAIARNREKREPAKSPYDVAFVKQLEAFLPHLKEVRFNGGEPFLNEINFTIIEKLLDVNPKANIVMATNGTVLNDRIKSLLGRGRFHINLSIDSLDKENYERIRINGSFEKVMQHFQYFHHYCRKQKTTLCLLTNPMPQNWQEMPGFIRFCNSHNIPLWFNTIIAPKSCALWALPSLELKKVFKELAKHHFRANPFRKQSRHNASVYNNLVHSQIKNWIIEAEERETSVTSDFIGNANANSEEVFLNNLFQHLKAKYQNEEEAIKRYEAMVEKLELLIKQMPAGFEKEAFFTKLDDLPMNIVAGELEFKSVKELQRLVETKL